MVDEKISLHILRPGLALRLDGAATAAAAARGGGTYMEGRKARAVGQAQRWRVQLLRWVGIHGM